MPPKFKRNLSSEDLLHAGDVETECLLEKEDRIGDDGDGDEDFFLHGPSPRIKSVRFEEDGKIKHVQNQIAEVTGVMRDNVDRMLERGQRLDDLQESSDRLNVASTDFQAAATRLKRRAWWQHTRTRIAVGGAIVVILFIIIVPVIVHWS